MESGEARDFAEVAHLGQTDKGGRPVFVHLAEVAKYVDEASGGDDELIACGWLHDVVEDTTTTLTLLAMIGCTNRQLRVIDAVTRRNEPYDDYITRVIEAGPDAILVKRADLASNTQPERWETFDQATTDRLSRKYRAAIERLDQHA